MTTYLLRIGSVLATVSAAATMLGPATAHADNRRLNSGVISNVKTMQLQAGCTHVVKFNPQLQAAAQRHTLDVLNNADLDGDIGTDGSSTLDRAHAAGFPGSVVETIAINPALAISGLEILKQWYYDPRDFAIMSDCSNTDIGVWSENSLSRTVVVAVYGKPM